MQISDKALTKIYGTLADLENECNCRNICWKDYSQYKLGYAQTPYKPYIGAKYRNILFSGINLNEGNTSLDAIDNLVNEAEKYLKDERYKIFKQEGYGGSNFYYYVPLLSFMFKSMTEDKAHFSTEEDISWPNVQEGFQYCALTNLIKCSTNTPDRRSTPSETMFQNCSTKFREELAHLPFSVLVTFSYFKYPNLISEFFQPSSIIVAEERWRLSQWRDKWILELEHPMSTQVSRERKFQDYNAAMKTTVAKMMA